MKRILLFLIPFLITAAAVIGCFKVTQKISSINIPNLPSISFSDLVKLSRFSLEKAPSQSLVGTMTLMSGEVEYTSRLATESAKLNSAIDIQQGENLSTGSDGNIILNFKAVAELNITPDSSVGIVQTLPADLVFAQKSGIINFKKLGNYPVSIRSYHLLIENLGDVTVLVDKEKPIVTVTVNSGSATVAYNNNNNDTKMLTVEAGKSLIFNDDTRRVVTK